MRQGDDTGKRRFRHTCSLGSLPLTLLLAATIQDLLAVVYLAILEYSKGLLSCDTYVSRIGEVWSALRTEVIADADWDLVEKVVWSI